MAFKIKRGRPVSNMKIRSVSGITPAGYEFHSYSRKKKVAMFKKID